MNKVYVLQHGLDYEGSTVVGVFATYEDASVAEVQLEVGNGEYSLIEEFEVQGALSTNT